MRMSGGGTGPTLVHPELEKPHKAILAESPEIAYPLAWRSQDGSWAEGGGALHRRASGGAGRDGGDLARPGRGGRGRRGLKGPLWAGRRALREGGADPLLAATPPHRALLSPRPGRG